MLIWLPLVEASLLLRCNRHELLLRERCFDRLSMTGIMGMTA